MGWWLPAAGTWCRNSTILYPHIDRLPIQSSSDTPEVVEYYPHSWRQRPQHTFQNIVSQLRRSGDLPPSWRATSTGRLRRLGVRSPTLSLHVITEKLRYINKLPLQILPTNLAGIGGKPSPRVNWGGGGGIAFRAGCRTSATCSCFAVHRCRTAVLWRHWSGSNQGKPEWCHLVAVGHSPQCRTGMGPTYTWQKLPDFAHQLGICTRL